MLLALLIGVVSMQAWGLSLFGAKLNYQQAGTWGEWMSAVGTVGAVFVALGAITKEQNRDRQERAQRDIEQRTRVYAFTDVEEAESPTSSGQRFWVATVVNRTESVVYGWQLYLEGVAQHLCAPLNGPIVPDTNKYELALAMPPNLALASRLVLRFRDRIGATWIRYGDGRLMTASWTPCEHEVQVATAYE